MVEMKKKPKPCDRIQCRPWQLPENVIFLKTAQCWTPESFGSSRLSSLWRNALPKHPFLFFIQGNTFSHFFKVVMKQNAAIEHLKQKKTMTPAEREENQRLVSLLGWKQEGSYFRVRIKWSHYVRISHDILFFLEGRKEGGDAKVKHCPTSQWRLYSGCGATTSCLYMRTKSNRCINKSDCRV